MTEKREQDELQEMIGEPRGWILRWGMTALLVLVLLFLVLGILISYPDKLPGTIQLTSGEPPVEVHALQTGRITELLVTDGQTVTAGQWLAIRDNTARTEDVLQLRTLVTALEGGGQDAAEAEWPLLKLGSLQESYGQLQFQVEYLREWKMADQTSAKLQLIEARMAELDVVGSTLGRQEELLREEAGMADQSLARQRELYERGAISLVELEAMERQVFHYRRELEELRIRQASNRQLIQVLKQDQLEMQEDQGQWLADRSATIQESLQQLRSALLAWEQSFVFVAPANGRAYLGKLRVAGQEVVAGELLFTIIPPGGIANWRGQMQVSDQGAGKIHLRDLVEVELNDFPHDEYGRVEGIVSGISVTPEAGQYLIEVDFASPLRTRYDREIPIRPLLQGRAAVITEKRSLLSRIFADLRARWSGN
jgi:multidrug resistance efflux pump